MPKKRTNQEKLLPELEDLRARLHEAEETLRAIRSGEVDALIVTGVGGEQVYTLKGADHSYRALIEDMSEGALTLTAEGVILYANRRFAEMLKTPLEKVIGSTIHTWITPDSKRLFQSLLRKCVDNKRREQLVLIAGDGTLMPISLSASNLLISGMSDSFCLVATDLTEQKRSDAIVASEKLARELLAASDQSRLALLSVIKDQKRAEEALRESEARYRAIFEASAEGILIADLETKIFKYANPTICRMLGYTENELITMSVADIHPKDALQGVIAEFEAQARGEKTLAAGLPCLRKDGTVFYADVNAVKITIDGKVCNAGFFRDITERRRADEALRESEERFRILFEQAADIILQLEIMPEGMPVIREANSATFRLLGYEREELIGRPVSFIEAAPDASKVVNERRQNVLSGIGTVFESRHRCKDNTILDVECSVSEIQVGSKTFAISVERDITERKQAVIELKKAHDELEKKVEERTAELNHANKAKSDFLASMSHELRTPLNSVIGFSQVLQEQYFGPLNEKQLEYTRDIEEGGNHLLSLINDVLDLSKIEAGKEAIDLSTFNLSLLLKNSFVMIKEKCHKHGIALSADIPAGLEEVKITADERKIKQVVFNLLSNASKFTRDGGAIKLGLRRNGDEFLVVVTDNGIGVPMEYQQKIFEDFYQISSGLTSKTRGTGLGLALCKRLVEMHGGKIWVVSEGAEKGSAFSFSIPVKTQPSGTKD